MGTILTDGWVENANADNGVATATHTGDPNAKNIVSRVDGSFNGAGATALLQIKVDGVTKWEQVCRNKVDFQFRYGEIIALRGKDITAVLAASGTGGIVGYVSIGGFHP